jgi:hypothetical protein
MLIISNVCVFWMGKEVVINEFMLFSLVYSATFHGQRGRRIWLDYLME